jgi:hypothetical protein
MNKNENNRISPARKPSPLVRIWRSTGGAGTPLVCKWVVPDAAAAKMNTCDQKIVQSGGLLLCA